MHAACARDEAAERVNRFLGAHGLEAGIVRFDRSTATAAAAAEAAGCDLGQIAKSLVFSSDAGPVLVLIAGDRRGDAPAIAREMAVASVTLADPDAVLAATGYPVGAVSPFDLPGQLPVLIDASLGRFETVFPAAGTDASVVGVPFARLVDVTRGRVCEISQVHAR